MKTNSGQLSAFATVIREGSFEGAARRLCLTPSAVSQRIKQLEDRLGQVLILRGSPCEPTHAGKVLLKFTEQLDFLEAELFQTLGVLGNELSSHFRVPVAVNCDSLDGWFQEAMQIVCQDTTITLDVRVEDQDHSAGLLREGAVIAAVSGSAAPVQGCSTEYLGDMRYIALAAPPFVARHFPEGVTAHRLATAPMLAFNSKDKIQESFVGLYCHEPIQPPRHFIPTTRSFVEALRLGMAWAMVPEGMADAHIATGQLQEIAPGRWIDVPLHWHCCSFSSPVLHHLSAAVRKSAGRALHKKNS